MKNNELKKFTDIFRIYKKIKINKSLQGYKNNKIFVLYLRLIILKPNL